MDNQLIIATDPLIFQQQKSACWFSSRKIVKPEGNLPNLVVHVSMNAIITLVLHAK